MTQYAIGYLREGTGPLIVKGSVTFDTLEQAKRAASELAHADNHAFVVLELKPIYRCTPMVLTEPLT